MAVFAVDNERGCTYYHELDAFYRCLVLIPQVAGKTYWECRGTLRFN